LATAILFIAYLHFVPTLNLATAIQFAFTVNLATALYLASTLNLATALHFATTVPFVITRTLGFTITLHWQLRYSLYHH
jgi:hypothetical protein